MHVPLRFEDVEPLFARLAFRFKSRNPPWIASGTHTALPDTVTRLPVFATQLGSLAVDRNTTVLQSHPAITKSFAVACLAQKKHKASAPGQLAGACCTLIGLDRAFGCISAAC